MYEPIVDTTVRVGEVLLQACDSTSKGPRKNNDNIIKIKTGPNLGKLAVWTRTINRQDQLVIETLSFQLFHCSNLFSTWSFYLLLTKNCHRWWLQCGAFTMAEDLVGSMDKRKSPLRQASRLSFVLKSCLIDIVSCEVFICVCRLSSKASGATIVPAASLLLMMSHSTMGWVYSF